MLQSVAIWLMPLAPVLVLLILPFAKVGVRLRTREAAARASPNGQAVRYLSASGAEILAVGEITEPAAAIRNGGTEATQRGIRHRLTTAVASLSSLSRNAAAGLTHFFRPTFAA